MKRRMLFAGMMLVMAGGLLSPARLSAQAVERFVTADRPSSRIQAFNVSNNAKASDSLSGVNPEGIAISPNGRLVAVANVNGSSVSLVDLTVNAEVAQIKNVFAISLAFNASGTRLVIPNRAVDEVVIVDTSTFQVLQRVSVNGLLGDDPANNSDTNLGPIVVVGNKAYVMNGGFNPITGNELLIAVIDINTYAVSTVPGTDGVGGIIHFNNTIAATPDGQFVLATQTFDGVVQIISTATNTVVQTVSIPAGPTAIAISRVLNDPNGIFAYATSFPTVANSAADLVVIDLRPASVTYQQVISTIHLPGAVAPQLTEIQLTEDDSRAYVALGGNASPNVFVVDTGLLLTNPATAILNQMQIGSDLRSIAVGVTLNTPPATAPVITKVSPTSVLNNTATSIRLTGSNYTSNAMVRVGGRDPMPGTVSSSSIVDVTVPTATPSQLADLIVTNPNSASAVSDQQQSGILKGALTVASPPSFVPNYQVLVGSFAQSVLNVLNSGNASAVAPASPSLTLSPFGIGITPDGTHAFVSLFTTASFTTLPPQVAIYNLVTNQVESIVTLPGRFGAGQGDSIAIAPNPATGKPVAYTVIGFRAGPLRSERLVALDADSSSPTFGTVLFTQDATYPNVARPRAGLSATPDGKFVYSNALIPGSTDGRLTVYDVVGGTTATLSTTALGVDSFMNFIRVTPDGKSLLLFNTTTGGLLLFDIGANPKSPIFVTKITGTPPMGIPALFFTTGVVVGAQLFAYDAFNNILQVFNYDRMNNNYSLLGSVQVPGSKGGFNDIGVTPDGRQIYVANSVDNAVDAFGTAQVIAGSPSSLLTSIGTALAPLAVAIRAGAPTPAGNGVVTNPIPGVTITGNVTVGGVSNAATLTSPPLPVPAGYRAGVPPIFYQLSSTATFNGLQTICISYAGISYVDETKLQMLEIQNGVWMDVTTSVDTVNKIVCGQVSALGTFALFERIVFNPVPTINLPLSPLTVAPGGGSFVLTLRGTGFAASSVVRWNGSPLLTTFVNSTKLTCIVPAANIVSSGTGQVTVFNPGPGGGVSSSGGVGVTSPTLAPAFLQTQFNANVAGPSAIAIGDVNGDGFPDVIITNPLANSVTVFLNDGAGNYTTGIDYPTSLMPVAVAIGDFNGDGFPDLVVVSQGSNCVSILLNNGNGTFGLKTDFFTSLTPTSVAVADLNGDGNIDIAVSSAGSNCVSVLLGFGDGTFGPKTDFLTSHNPRSIAIGDINGDGIPDIIVVAEASDCISILLGQPGGGYAAHYDYLTGPAPVWIVLADFNGDGILDVAVACSGDDTVGILLGGGSGGVGDGTFGGHTNYPVAGGIDGLAAGDWNGDGIIDLAASCHHNTASFLQNDGSGGFTKRFDVPLSDDATGLASEDTEHKGRRNVIVIHMKQKCTHLHNIIDTTPPVGTPPAAITIPATEATGARGNASAVLAAFLAGATAVDNADPNPVQLSPQVNGSNIDNTTLFPLGGTSVTFSFRDANGNVGAATSSVTVIVGVPRIAGTIVNKGVSSGVRFYDIQLTNNGTGNARNLIVTQVLLRTLSGTGTVTYNTLLSPALPLNIGSLDVNATTKVRVFLNVPATVTRFSITENGTVQDVTGLMYRYSVAQATAP